MYAADLFDDVCQLVCSNDAAMRAGFHWAAFPTAFVRDGVLHARRRDAAVTVARVGQSLEVRTWALNDINDADLVDLVAESRMLTDEPDMVDSIARFKHVEPAEQIFEMGAFLVQQVHMANMAVRFAGLLARVPGLSLWSAEGFAPFMAEGFWHGYRLVFRARQQTATLKILMPDDSVEALWVASETVDEPEFLSVMSDEEFVFYFLRLAERLEVAPFPYRFADLETEPRHYDIVGNPIRNLPIIGWGHSPEEGRQRAVESFLRAYPGADPEVSIARDPRNVDEREFPRERPDFAILK